MPPSVQVAETAAAVMTRGSLCGGRSCQGGPQEREQSNKPKAHGDEDDPAEQRGAKPHSPEQGRRQPQQERVQAADIEQVRKSLSRPQHIGMPTLLVSSTRRAAQLFP